MKKEKIEKITRIIIIFSIVGVFIADFFLAYYIDIHNASGLLNFGYGTNLTFLLMFSFPIIFILLNIFTFIKEMILLKIKENTKVKTKLSAISFLLALIGFLLYFVASSITSTIAIALGGVSVILILASIIVFFVYIKK